MTDHLKLRNLIFVAEATIFLALFSQVTIPFGPIPFTGQTFALGVLASLLRTRESFWTVFLYILLGTLGLPVFAGFSSGLPILVGPTAGYLWAFFLQVLFIGWAKERFGHGFWTLLLLNLIGMLFPLICGSLWLMHVLHLSLLQGFLTGFLPYVLVGILKAVLGTLLVQQLLRVLTKHPRLAPYFNEKNGNS